MNFSRLILVSLTLLVFFAERADACQCREYGTPVCAAYWRADAVFVGQIANITLVKPKSQDEMPTAMLHFNVEQPFRGINAAQVNVATLHGTSCDMEFIRGKRYLIYASLDPETKQLFAAPCTRTTGLKYADEDLNYIRSVTQQVAKESIGGRVVRDRYEGLEGLKIAISSGDKTLETTTDEQGDFSIMVPGPAAYKVRAFVPYAAAVLLYQGEPEIKVDPTDELTTIEYEVKLDKNECGYRQLDVYKINLHATAQITGSVLTSSGGAVTKGYLHLVDAVDTNRDRSEKIGESGSFSFEGVAPGEYYLVLNPRGEAPQDYDAPYPRMYYPSAAEPKQATKIVVTEGAKLENLVLRLGEPWKERTISGSVAWTDGRRVQNAHVSLYDGSRYLQWIKVDEKGKFEFKLYGEFDYAIEAECSGKVSGRSERMPIKEKLTGLRLVLKRVN